MPGASKGALSIGLSLPAGPLAAVDGSGPAPRFVACWSDRKAVQSLRHPTRKLRVNKIRIQAAAAVLVAAGAGVAIAAAAPASAKPAGQTISFTEHQISDQNLNLGSAHNIAVGAVELSANTLMQGSKQIGRDGVSCTFTRFSAQSADDLCLAGSR